MPRERFKLIPAVDLVLLRGDELLLARRRGTPFGAGEYALVQGHVEGGETAPAAVAREAREEVGIAIAPEDLRCVHVMHRNSEVGEWLDLDLTWRRGDDLPKNTMAYIRLALERWRRGESFSTYGWIDAER